MIRSIVIISICLAYGVGFTESKEKTDSVNQQLIIQKCLRDLNLYSVILEDATRPDQDEELAAKRNTEWLKRIVKDLQTVTNIEAFISKTEKEFAEIRASGPGWNHPDIKARRRAIEVLKNWVKTKN